MSDGMEQGSLDATIHGLSQDEYRRLCLLAFENLPTDTTVTMDDVDAILTWCLPEYDRLKAEGAPGGPHFPIMVDDSIPSDEIRFVSSREEDGQVRHDMVVLRLDEGAPGE
jgi:hypothetical protein